MTRRLLSLLALAALALSTMGASCGKHKPPQPQQPTCPAGMHDEGGTCVPDVATMPAPGVPIAPERLLRTDGPKLAGDVEAFGCFQCCRTFQPEGVEVNSGWPMASEAWQDWAHAYGCNWFGLRFGPFLGDADHESEFSATGGPYKVQP